MDYETNIIDNEHKTPIKIKLTPYERNKLWRKQNPEKYKEQDRRKYLARKERLKQSLL